MKCDSQVSLLAYTFVSLCLGHEPKVKVATTNLFYDGLIDASCEISRFVNEKII